MFKITNQTTNKYSYLWIIFIFLFALFIPFLITWLFVGEINLSHNNWMVGLYGKNWGVLSDGTIGFGINSMGVLTSWQPYIICLSFLIFNVLLWLILVFCKQVQIPLLAFIIATWILLFVIFVSGLLVPNPKDQGEIGWKITVRIIVVILAFVISFLTCNWLINKFLLNSRLATEYAENIFIKEKDNQEYIKDNIQTKKKSRQKEKIIIKDDEL